MSASRSAGSLRRRTASSRTTATRPPSKGGKGRTFSTARFTESRPTNRSWVTSGCCRTSPVTCAMPIGPRASPVLGVRPRRPATVFARAPGISTAMWVVVSNAIPAACTGLLAIGGPSTTGESQPNPTGPRPWSRWLAVEGARHRAFDGRRREAALTHALGVTLAVLAEHLDEAPKRNGVDGVPRAVPHDRGEARREADPEFLDRDASQLRHHEMTELV